jgi:hypothetical protein
MHISLGLCGVPRMRFKTPLNICESLRYLTPIVRLSCNWGALQTPAPRLSKTRQRIIDNPPVQTADILVKSGLNIAYGLGDDLRRLNTSQNIGPRRLVISGPSAGATDFGDEALISAIGNDCVDAVLRI